MLIATVAFTLSAPGDATGAPKGQAPCSKRVLKDWIVDGTVDGRYASWCTKAAVDRAPKDVLKFVDFAKIVAKNERQVKRQHGGPPKSCSEGVLMDWIAHGTIMGIYPKTCLRAAIKNAPSDVKAVPTFTSAIRKAIRVKGRPPPNA